MSARQMLPLTSADVYDLLYYVDRPVDRALQKFLRSVLRNVADQPVLDCACGTGAVPLSLAQHINLTVTDGSRAMVARTRALLRDNFANPPSVAVAKWSHLARYFKPKFAAVLCSGNSLAQCLDPTTRRLSLEGMRQVLSPSGFLYLDYLESWPRNGRVVTWRRYKTPPVTGLAERELCFVTTTTRVAEFVIREKSCFAASRRPDSALGCQASKYLPFTTDQLLGELFDAGFRSVVSLNRPGRWPMPALLARE